MGIGNSVNNCHGKQPGISMRNSGHVTQQSTSESMATTIPKVDLKGVWYFLSAVKGRYLEGTGGRKERRKNDVIHFNYK